MGDIFTPEKRSQIMSRIRASGTKPEQRLYEITREILGNRWRIDRNVSAFPGRPDIMIPSLSLVLLADGCFYHSCPKHGHEPKSRQDYWTPKLARNRRHDAANRRVLRTMGYTVWRFWEHDLRGARLVRTHEKLRRRLTRRTSARPHGQRQAQSALGLS